MAEISKLSKVAIADVAKVDAVLKADIANFNGLTIPSAAAFLLDTYTGAAAAYSVRRLNSLYTGACMRVREDGGNTETDIGFDANGDLDTAAIASHCGANNGFVRYWYDQSTAGGTGSGNDAGTATATRQPQIYNGTAVITENGISAIKVPATGQGTSQFTTSAYVAGSSNGILISGVGNSSSNASYYWSNAQKNIELLQSFFKSGGTQVSGGSIGHKLSLGYHDSGTNYYRQNGTQINTASAPSPTTDSLTTRLLSKDAGAYSPIQGSIQELIIWPSNTHVSDIGGIETNINDYFSIYT